MRRRALLAATATAATGGCAGLVTRAAERPIPVPTESSHPSDTSPDGTNSSTADEPVPDASPSEWRTTTDGDGDALARSPSDLYFRVNGCSDASAVREYSVESDEATISFDYEVTAERWWERPYLRVYDGDTTIYDSSGDPTRHIVRTEGGTTTGTFEIAVSTSGTITVEFGIERSRHCENGDHANTYFRVHGLNVSPERPAWQTNRSGNGAALPRERSAVDLRVYRCARASAIRAIEEPDGDVTISFDYEVAAEGWWERPYLRVYDGGTRIYDSDGDDDRRIEREDHTTTVGTFQVTVSPDSDVEVELGIEPSRHCSNYDHANTHFRITDFSAG